LLWADGSGLVPGTLSAARRPALNTDRWFYGVFQSAPDLIRWLAAAPDGTLPSGAVPTELDSPEASVDAFERYVRSLCPGDPPVFDVMLLGLGEDGHTASLFPGTPATQVRDRMVTIGAGKGLERISLTAPVLSAARQVIVLVSGAGKRQALQRLLDPAESPERTPAKLVQPHKPVLVMADAAAAEGL